MSTVSRTVCDGCAVVIHDNAAKPAKGDREVSIQITSIDPAPTGEHSGEETYRFRATSWDLCVPCGTAAYTLLVDRFGKPEPDDIREVLP